MIVKTKRVFAIAFFFLIAKITNAMTPKVIEGIIKNGKIFPKKNIPKTMSGLEVRIFVLPLGKEQKERMQYFGAIKKGWGDPVKYQRKLRNEFEKSA